MKTRLPILALLVLPAALAAQEPAHTHAHGAPQLGTVSFPNSGAAAAQAPFLRGLAFLHNFEYTDAADAFREAQRADPRFAMAFWGEALTYSHVVWGEEDLPAARAVLARLAPTPVARLALARTPRERAYGAAVEAFFADAPLGARAAAFADSMRAIAARDTADLEAASLASLALQMALYSGGVPAERRAAVRGDAISLAERVFRIAPQHPGATHYLIHATDAPGFAARGLDAARAYARIAPDAEHALHMPSHIFLQVGMWDDVVASNERAWAASREWVRARGASPLELSFHTLIWLQYGYLQQGRFAAARALVDTAHAVLAGADLSPADGADARLAEPAMRFALAAATGDWTLVPAAGAPRPGPSSAAPSLRAWSFANVAAFQQAAAAGMRGDTAAPAAAARDFQQLIDAGEAALGLRLYAMELRAIAAHARGDRAGAVALMREAAAVEDRTQPVGPPWSLPAHEMLGALLLQAGDARGAAEAYERALAIMPNRSSALLGLARARAAQGQGDASIDAARRLLANWQRGDDTRETAEARHLAAGR